MWVALLESSQAHPFDPDTRFFPRSRAGPSTQKRAQLDILENCLPREQRILLEHVTSLAVDPGYRLAQSDDSAGRRRQQPGDNVKQ